MKWLTFERDMWFLRRGFSTLDNKYHITETGSTEPYSFNLPDFKAQQFQSNFVFRWEYKPSSTLYIVRTHGRNNHEFIPDYQLGEAVSGLFNIYPENAFMVKFNYWFSL